MTKVENVFDTAYSSYQGDGGYSIRSLLSQHDPLLAHEILAPAEREVTGYNLPVRGEIPRELDGILMRNGSNPNPRLAEGPYNWFIGDGMVHGIDIQDGVARWYRSRFVQTRLLAEDLGTPVPLHPQLPEGHLSMVANPSNTNVVEFGGHILTLCESGLPYEINSQLDTVCEYDFAGSLKYPMTAHPKVDPKSGELFGVGYSPFEPWLVYHRVDPTTMQVKSEPVSIKGPTMIHDLALTENFVVIPDLPLLFDMARIQGPRSFPWAQTKEHGTRIGLIPKNGSAKDIVWYEADEPYVFTHVMNAHEVGQYVHLDVCNYDDWMVGDFTIALRNATPTTFDRLTINRETGKITKETIAEVATDFPKHDDRREGLPYRYGYAVEFVAAAGSAMPTSRIVKLDAQTGGTEFHDFGPGRWALEPIFVPSAESNSDEDGWVLTIVGEQGCDHSDLVILDASRFSEPNPTMARLPARVPLGFHGSWISRDAVDASTRRLQRA